ncbi:MAG: MOSC domain-containing protein [Hyphomicrobium sp.]
MPAHRSLDDLQAGLPHILDSPADNGLVRAIVVRPGPGQRAGRDCCEISLAGGVHGDAWANGCWKSTDDGRPHPDVQICIMNARTIETIAGESSNWLPAGDNLFIDLDLSPENLPAGQRLAIGTAIIEVTDTPHNGCANFTQRYGRDATIFVNKGEGRRLRLRGIYARVVQDGRVSTGDRVTKVPAALEQA